MASKSVEFAGNTIVLNGQPRALPYPVDDAFSIGDTIVVLYEYDAADPKISFHNLVALDETGSTLWTADLPDVVADAYTQVVSREPLIICSWSGFKCTIDVATGRIVEAEFTK